MRSENSVTKDVGTLDRLMKDGCKQNIYEVFFGFGFFFKYMSGSIHLQARK